MALDDMPLPLLCMRPILIDYRLYSATTARVSVMRLSEALPVMVIDSRFTSYVFVYV